MRRGALLSNAQQNQKEQKIQISGSVKLHIGDSWGKPEMHKCPGINVLSVVMHTC